MKLVNFKEKFTLFDQCWTPRIVGEINNFYVKIFNKEKFRHEGKQIYVIKASEDRFFCFFFRGAKVIVTNAYEKKSAKMPLREKQKALNAKVDYIKRVKGGIYYD